MAQLTNIRTCSAPTTVSHSCQCNVQYDNVNWMHYHSQSSEDAPESKRAACEEVTKEESHDQTEEETKPPPLKKEDSIAETLTCQICQVQRYKHIS